MRPQPVLTGGGALVGFYTLHRTTRDLDLFWRELSELGNLSSQAVHRLRADGLSADVLQDAPAFCRLRVGNGEQETVVDLVADPVPALEPPATMQAGEVAIAVDSRHEILVNKLCALLSRSELRDLEDLRVLTEAGGDLARALAEAPRRDSGFSPLTLAWLVQQLDVSTLGRSLGWPPDATARLEQFKGRFVEQLLAHARPGRHP
jgi:hypothetical protein